MFQCVNAAKATSVLEKTTLLPLMLPAPPTPESECKNNLYGKSAMHRNFCDFPLKENPIFL